MTLAAIQPLKINGTFYGPQPPQLNAIPLELIEDLEYPALGPAYHLQGLFNRAVILTESQIINGSSQIHPLDPAKVQVQPGDRPWVCAFNETLFEGFIYVFENSSLTRVNRDGNASNSLMDSLPVFPSAIKIVERRIANTTQPYCIQMDALEDGSLVHTTGISGFVEILQLNETDPTLQELGLDTSTNLKPGKRGDSQTNGCVCQWMLK